MAATFDAVNELTGLSLTIELCAGSAGLSAAIAEQGMEAVAVDHAFNSHVPKVPCIRLDLSDERSWQVLR